MTTREAPLPEKQWSRIYGRELALMLAAYGALLVPTLVVVDRLTGGLRYLVSALPILPFGWMGFITVRHLRRIDEREQMLVYRAITFAFFGTSVLTFGYGFLENAGAPQLSMLVVWPLMATLWVLGRFAAPRMP